MIESSQRFHQGFLGKNNSLFLCFLVTYHVFLKKFASMRTHRELLERIESALNALPLNLQPERLYDPIQYVLTMGGKRIRPAMCLMACELFDEEIDKALKAALALEIFHNFTLLHDDIMDKAPTRRNRDCVHVKWNENVAILSGDAMQILAYKVLGEASPAYLLKALPIFTKTAIEVCEGQQFDMDFEQRCNVTTAEYLSMIRLKTAVLIAASLQMGALAGGASDYDAELLYQFGIDTGLAFQLKDDLLDVYGDSESFGKQIGGDILCNKKTFLLTTALTQADPATHSELMDWLNDTKSPSIRKIKGVTNIFNKLGIKEQCMAEIEKHQQMALDSLQQVTVPGDRKAVLIQLTHELTDRNK